MITIFKILLESVRQAFQQLAGNKLRSFLSLLGVTIGIFCIIGVQSAVDSLEDNVRGSFEKLGNDVLYIKKFSWSDTHLKWWQYIKRPNPNYDDYKIVSKKVKSAGLTGFHAVVGFRTVKYKSNSVSQTVLIGMTPEIEEMFNMTFEKGRFFSSSEYYHASNKIIMGHKVAEELFGTLEPVGKKVKVQGKTFEVIGIIEKAGDDLINVMDFDDCIMVSYEVAKSMANLKAKYIFDTTVTVKAADGVALEDLKDETTGVLRAHRRLKPKEDDSFSLNELTMLTGLLDGFFNVLSMAGLFIGLFAILVGMFSVANIMFVSVKERTGIIGIKKALGAKRYVILLEFLIESIILCILGGIMGLALVHLIVTIISNAIDFNMYLSWNNIMVGIGLSVFVGVVSGFIPAFRAANMDPVVAMRK